MKAAAFQPRCCCRHCRLAVVQGAILARITRSAVLEVLREDFVRTARAKGCSRAPPVGPCPAQRAHPGGHGHGAAVCQLLAGTIVVENVFYLPGLGRLIFQSIANRDVIVVRNCVMLLAAMVVVVNFFVDVLYALIDPRVKAGDLLIAPFRQAIQGFWHHRRRVHRWRADVLVAAALLSWYGRPTRPSK
jgi:ABC-type antimicrobial peptide transport system permease subunit